MPVLQYSSGRYSVTVPKEYVEFAKWKPGQVLLVNLRKDGVLELVPGQKVK